MFWKCERDDMQQNDLVPGPERDSQSRRYWIPELVYCSYKQLGPSAFLNVQRDDAGRLIKLWLEPREATGRFVIGVRGSRWLSASEYGLLPCWTSLHRGWRGCGWWTEDWTGYPGGRMYAPIEHPVASRSITLYESSAGLGT